jgi:hypothetical protein
MGFPEMSRDDDGGHADALRKLDHSVEEMRELTQRRDLARETPDERQAEAQLAAGRARAAAREAWLVWIKRGE